MRIPVLVLCLAAGLWPCVVVRGQMDPNDPISHPDGRADRQSDVATTSAPLPGRLTQHLWQSRIAAPAADEDAETRRSIAELIRQIRSVKFEENSPAATFTPPAETPVESEPQATAPTVSDQPKPAEPSMTAPTAPTVPASALPQTTLKRLDGLLQDPAGVRNPLELAELLFLSGRVTEAGVFYQKALALMSPDDTTASQDRAWVLFQLGNCLRETNLTQAKAMYMQLIADYPNSPWTELAKVHGRLIAWHQSANPQQLIAQPESP